MTAERTEAPDLRSTEARAMEQFLWDQGGKANAFVSTERAKAYIEARRPQNAKPHRIPADAGLVSAVREDEFHGMQVFTLNPEGAGAGRPVVLYLHGGAYVNQPTVYHWRFWDRVAAGAGCTFVIPIYPKAPNATFRASYEVLMDLSRALLGQVSPTRLLLMGDSAGAALALGLTELFPGHGLPKPAHLVLLSPWLDIATDNPDIEGWGLEAVDPMLGAPGLAEMGRVWADGADPRDPRLSPMYGDLHGLPPVTVYTGTREILWPDALKFCALAREQGAAVDCRERAGMNHVFPVYPIPEAEIAQQEIIRIIEQVSHLF